MLADRAYNPLCLSIWQSVIKTRKSTVLHIWPWVCVADGNSNTFVIMYMMMLWNHEILWQPYSEISLIYRCYWVRFQFCHPVIWIYCVVPLFLVNYTIKWIIFYVQMQLQSVLPFFLCVDGVYFTVSFRRRGGQKSLLVRPGSGARALWGALLKGLRAQRLDLLVYLFSDLLQQNHRGKADEDTLHSGL